MRQITISLNRDGFTVEDDEHGIGLYRPGYVHNLMGTLVGGPVPCSSMVSGCLWLLLRSEISRCNPAGGLQWTQTFAWGTPDGPPTQKLAVGTNTGTLMVARLATGMSIVRMFSYELVNKLFGFRWHIPV